MSIQCGIIGLPNVGKSTLFSALTHTQVHTDTYPFTTVEPNIGIVPVPDDRLTRLSRILKPEKVTPTTLRILDIAGLIKGSHRGEGLGNQFLAQIREVGAVLHLVRCFMNDQVSHTSDGLDPVRDIDIVETEIILKDIETVTNRLEKTASQVKGGDGAAAQEKEVLDKVAVSLDRGVPARKIQMDTEESLITRNLFLISAKPVLYVANVNEEEMTSHHPGSSTETLSEWAKEHGEKMLVLSATLEHELAFLENEEERHFFMEEWGIRTTGLQSLLRESYALLNLVTFFTTESDHAQAWTVKRNTPAPRAAGVIHSDFEREFIKADVYHCTDLFAHPLESELRERGLIHTHGREYLVQDGDVVKFKHSPTTTR